MTDIDFEGLSNALTTYVENVGGDTAAAATEAAKLVHMDITDLSPVKSGNYVTNWKMSAEGGSTSASSRTKVIGRLALAMAGPRERLKFTRRQIESIVTAERNKFVFKEGDTGIIFYNDVPYADKIEDGSSKQAPHGVAKVIVPKYKKYFDKLMKAKGYT